MDVIWISAYSSEYKYDIDTLCDNVKSLGRLRFAYIIIM